MFNRIKCYKCWVMSKDIQDLKIQTWTLEVWGSSTKHPDYKFYFSDFKKSEWVDEQHQVFQWLLECASKMLFPQTAKKISDYAYENFITWE